MNKLAYILFLTLFYSYSQALDSRGILSKYFESDFVVNIDRSYEFRRNGDVSTEFILLCQGATISETQVVTSADCLTPSKHPYKTSYRNITIKHNNVRYEVNNIHEHNSFSQDSSHNLSILELDKPIEILKYPSFISSESLEDMIQNGKSAHMLYQNENNAMLQSVIPISNTACKNILGSNINLNNSVLCFQSPRGKTIRVCPAFQGTPITRVLDNGNIEIIGIMPKSSVASCQETRYVVSANLSQFKVFLDSVSSGEYHSQGPLTRGFIKSLPSGWHFLGTQESIDKDLSYILDYAKKIYLYLNSNNSYNTWVNSNNNWGDDLFIPSRSGFWLQR